MKTETRTDITNTQSHNTNSTHSSKNTYRLVMAVAIASLVIVFIIALSVGRYSVSFLDTVKILISRIIPLDPVWGEKTDAVIMTLRLPRGIAAILIGAALSLSGACYQSIFKNPMVSPDLLGVSSGACVGAACAILINGNAFQIQIFAFLFGIGTVFLTTLIPRLIRNQSTVILVLSGVIISSLMSSVMNIIKSLADPDTKLAEITYWMMGSLSSVKMIDVRNVLITIIVPAVIILAMRFRLNVMSLGDNEARMLGINLPRTRGAFILCATLLTASCVCLAGTIGWIGLVIPHVSRMIVGADNKKMLPAALVFGAIFMLIIDTLCRTLSAAELKIGILTGIIGAPFFIFILIKQHRNLR